LFFNYVFFRYTSSSLMIFIVFHLRCSNYLIICSWFLQVFCGFFESLLVFHQEFIVSFFDNYRFFIDFPQLELHLSSDFVVWSTFTMPMCQNTIHIQLQQHDYDSIYFMFIQAKDPIWLQLLLNSTDRTILLGVSLCNVHWILRTSFLWSMVPLQFQINCIWIEVCRKGVIT